MSSNPAQLVGLNDRGAFEAGKRTGTDLIAVQAPSRAKDDLKKATVSHLRRLLNSPQRVMRYFQHPKLHDTA
ncbi:hypothetical protein GWK36_08585 [Caldichromatium japonicum]|uniref:Uncharacterized protein n=1 Tax=Caldichromatium japonicum TaxID=2699430 RepID=A0A6G7VD84_9GAMM|nr:hypothetical protein [Caldichromatium japonicum]QIK38033.1 hypothetical protein GWK36_08585 [Caldichromatium japonicum]